MLRKYTVLLLCLVMLLPLLAGASCIEELCRCPAPAPPTVDSVLADAAAVGLDLLKDVLGLDAAP